MALSPGAYRIINVGSSKGLDVKGDSDKSKANVFQYSVNNTDGQYWSVYSTKSGIQLNCILSGKSLDIQGSKVKKGVNVYQYSDKNTKTQRWSVVAIKGAKKSYGGKSYQVYVIKPKSNKKFAIGIKGDSNSNKANAEIQEYSKSKTHQRWIFVPVSRFKTDDEYRLILCSNTKRSIGPTGKGTKNNTNIVPVGDNQDDNSQVWKTVIDSQNQLVKFLNAESGLYLGVKGGSAKDRNNVVLSNSKTAATNWFVLPKGSVTINGTKRTRYRLRTELGSSELYLDTQGSNIRIASSTGKTDQLFAFVPTEIFGKNLSTPGGISVKSPLYRTGPGYQTVTGLSFKSTYKMFQARFKVRTYRDANCSKYDETDWMNLKDRSTGRGGWGDIRTATMNYSKSTDNVHDIPTAAFKKNNNSAFRLVLPKDYSKNHDADLKKGIFTGVAIDLIIEVRVYTTNYKNQGKTGWNAHGSAKQSTVKIRQKPTVSLTNIALDVSGNTVGVKSTISNTLDLVPNAFRSRVVGADGLPISGWMSVSSNTVTHKFGAQLTRIPNQNEKLTLDYVCLFRDNITVTGEKSKTFSKSAAGGKITPTFSKTTDGSCLVSISSPKFASLCCLMTVEDIDGAHLVKCDRYGGSGNTVVFRAAPPLNKNVKFELYGKNATGAYRYGSATTKVESHFSIWAWRENNTPFKNHAILMVNNDKPPEQTRTFSNDASIHLPSGRNWPVAFTGIGLTGDVSVKGVALDGSGGISYAASGPIPSHASIKYLGLLARLAGHGIHPIYRTPYGDWYQVVVKSVDLSKSELGLISVSISQEIVED